MRDQIGLNGALGGWIATFNYVGYVLDALIAVSIRKSGVTEERGRAGKSGMHQASMTAGPSKAMPQIDESTPWRCSTDALFKWAKRPEPRIAG